MANKEGPQRGLQFFQFSQTPKSQNRNEENSFRECFKIFRKIFQGAVKIFVVGRTKSCSVPWGDRFGCALIGCEVDETRSLIASL
jgi:hypothetical protein